MADSEMKAVGLKLKVDGTVDFKKSLTEVNNAVNDEDNSVKYKNKKRLLHEEQPY